MNYIFQKIGWKAAAMFTPIAMGVLAVPFFGADILSVSLALCCCREFCGHAAAKGRAGVDAAGIVAMMGDIDPMNE